MSSITTSADGCFRQREPHDDASYTKFSSLRAKKYSRQIDMVMSNLAGLERSSPTPKSRCVVDIATAISTHETFAPQTRPPSSLVTSVHLKDRRLLK